MLKNITIAGVGLIGGSLGLRLKTKQPGITITGTGRRESSLKKALDCGAVDRWTLDPSDAVRDADVVVLCTPVGLIYQQAKKFIPYMKKNSVLTDVGSVKKEIIDRIEPILPDGIYFVGAHPMAGNEKTGVDAAQENLFENAVCVITPTKKLPNDALHIVERIWHLAGAHVLIIDPEEHDHITAAISHLPHLVSSLLIHTAAQSPNHEKVLSLAAGGFRDTTRIAASDPVIWRDIFIHNRDAVLDLVDRFRKELDLFENAISKNNAEWLENYMASSKKVRDEIPHFKSGILPIYHQIFVRISDKPGELARVTRILSDKMINIKDLELTHSREEEEGPLLLSFDNEDISDKAIITLNDNGYKSWKK